MKKIVSAALCILLFAAMSAALAGSAGTAADPLVSLSYINDTFIPAVKNEGKASADAALGAVKSEAEARLDNIHASYSLRFGTPEGYAMSGGALALDMAAGSSVSLVTGSCITVTGGTVTLAVQSGAVVDASAGAEAATGAQLTKNARYICAEDTAAVFTASTGASVVVDGCYKTSGAVSRPLAFADVSASQWFYEAVAFVNEKGYMTGMSSSEFGVSVKTTRAVFVTALYRMAGSPAVAGASIFTDVTDASLYYYNAVIWSNANGVILGHDDGTFRPADSITREQMAAVMYRFARYRGCDVSSADAAAFNAFPDCASVNAYAADAMRWATARALINGMDGALNPGGTAIRAQVAQIILNFYKYLS